MQCSHVFFNNVASLGQLVETQWPYTTRVILGTDGIVNGSKETHIRIKRLALRAFSPRFMETYSKSVQRSIHIHIQVRCGAV